jgi:hypothetical protein
MQKNYRPWDKESYLKNRDDGMATNKRARKLSEGSLKKERASKNLESITLDVRISVWKNVFEKHPFIILVVCAHVGWWR